MSNQIFGKYVHSDLEINTITQYFNLQTNSGKNYLNQLFENPSSNIHELKNRQLIPLLFKKISKDNQPLLNSIKDQLTIFKENENFFENVKNLNEENISQILYSSKTPFGNYANQSSTILNAFHNWRTIFIPTSTIIAPVLAIILPFIILQFFDKKPTANEYLTIIQKTIKNTMNIPSFFKSKHENDRFGFLLESLYIGMTIAFFMTSLYNTYSNAMHLRNIANELTSFANQINLLLNCLNNLHTTFKTIQSIYSFKQLADESNSLLEELKQLQNKSGLGLFGTFYNNQSILDNLNTFIGKVDVYYSISQMQNISFTRFKQSKESKPILKLKNIYHPSLKEPVKNSFDSSHSIVTGPNRGGKSTFLKTVGLCVFLSQTVGFVFGSQCIMTPFELFETALSPVDCLGRLSLFESEIQFAKSILHSDKNPTLILMDEIFHSTNANDGYEASKIFLSQLYKQSHIISLISTHYHKLTDDFKDCMKPLQAYSEKINDLVKYSYKIIEGTSNVSSVLEILKEHNLVN
jgi:DNA mismatch repair ATPase MutS